MYARCRIALIVSVALATGTASAVNSSAYDKGLRFNSPAVLDLSDRSLRVANGTKLEAAGLEAADAERIFAAPAIGEDPLGLSFSGDVYGCKKASRKCSQDHERALIGASGSKVRRDGKRLTVTPDAGAGAVFIDWKQPTTKDADGDEETHWYLGTLPGSGYHRVEVEFGHDAPGNFLIHPQSGKIAFVHNAADLAVPSPDGRLLLTWNSLNPPLSLRVAALDATGPRLVLQCEAPEGKERLTPVFKGWHDAQSFEFVIEIGEQGKSMARLAAALARVDRGWHLHASDTARLARIGLACSVAAAPN